MPSALAGLLLAVLALQAPCPLDACPAPQDGPGPAQATLPASLPAADATDGAREAAAPALDEPSVDLVDAADPLLAAGVPPPSTTRLAAPAPAPAPHDEQPLAPDEPSGEPEPLEDPDPAPDPAHEPPPTAAGDPVSADQDGEPRSPAARALGTPVDEQPAGHTVAWLALGLAAVGLYQRLTKDRLLDHETRQRLLALLEERPGLTTSQLADRLDVSYRTARHHASKLARFDLLARVDRDGPERWALPDDAADVDERVPDELAPVLALLVEARGVHLSEVARRLEIAKATAKHRLDRLAERGWVEDERVGPLRTFEPTPEGRRRLEAGDS
jgi:DNA-binding MarR family transcriptional regulator